MLNKLKKQLDFCHIFVIGEISMRRRRADCPLSRGYAYASVIEIMPKLFQEQAFLEWIH